MYIIFDIKVMKIQSSCPKESLLKAKTKIPKKIEKKIDNNALLIPYYWGTDKNLWGDFETSKLDLAKNSVRNFYLFSWSKLMIMSYFF